jgi:hypothetical protein
VKPRRRTIPRRHAAEALRSGRCMFAEFGKCCGEPDARRRGTVQRAFIGQRSVCTHARFEDAGGPSVVKKIRCAGSDGLTIQFTPRPAGLNQSASWTLIDATGTFAGLTGGGTMFFRGTPGTRTGHEIFTGTLH